METIILPHQQEVKRASKLLNLYPSQIERIFKCIKTIENYLKEDGFDFTIENHGIIPCSGEVRIDSRSFSSPVLKYKIDGIGISFSGNHFRILLSIVKNRGLCLEVLLIEQEHRNKGLGKLLMDIILDAVDENRITISTIPTDLQGEYIEGVIDYLGFLRDWYSKLGFTLSKDPKWKGVLYEYHP